MPAIKRVLDDDQRRRAAWVQTRVQALWEEAGDPRGTLVQTYLRGRALDLPDDLAGSVLRFHPACPWKADDGTTIRVPAMIAAMRSIDSDRLTAVHRTRLTPEGRKVDRRMLGVAGGAAVKLDGDDAVSAGLTLGEGIETTLAARQVGLRPAWALGSVDALARFPLLNGIEAITLLAETDAKGANERAIEACGARWADAGRGVIVAAPLGGGDVNDALMRRAG